MSTQRITLRDFHNGCIGGRWLSASQGEDGKAFLWALGEAALS